MKVNVKKTEIIQSVDELPNGKYGGIWLNYDVKIELDSGITYRLNIDKGLKYRALCTVIKTDNGYEIEAI